MSCGVDLEGANVLAQILGGEKGVCREGCQGGRLSDSASDTHLESLFISFAAHADV